MVSRVSNVPLAPSARTDARPVFVQGVAVNIQKKRPPLMAVQPQRVQHRAQCQPQGVAPGSKKQAVKPAPAAGLHRKVAPAAVLQRKAAPSAELLRTYVPLCKAPSDAWSFRADGSDATFVLSGDTVLVGRWHERVALWLDDGGKPSMASRLHASLERDAASGEWTLVDNDSANGCFVNRARVCRAVLRAGDRVGFGR